MKRGDREYPQASQGGFGGAAGNCKQALRVGQLSALQTSKVTAHPEQIHVKLLQVLLPLLDLGNTETFVGLRLNIMTFWVVAEKIKQSGDNQGRRPRGSRVVGIWVSGALSVRLQLLADVGEKAQSREFDIKEGLRAFPRFENESGPVPVPSEDQRE